MLADHHRCVAEGMSALLAPFVASVELVNSGTEMITAARSGRFDVVVLELDMPDMPGLAPLRALMAEPVEGKAMVLSSHEEPLTVRDAMHAGAWAYVLKRSPSTELLEAIAEVHDGRRYVSPGLMATLINARVTALQLTRRQHEVLERMARGKRSADIAQDLGISIRTVESHRQALLDMLGVHSGVALVREAVRLGLVREDPGQGS
jgi:DNA-binding NarL/FixJ family response regulator